jgi:hypothetical protein
VRLYWTEAFPGHLVVEAAPDAFLLVAPNGEQRRFEESVSVLRPAGGLEQALLRVLADDLVAVAELARRAGVKANTVQRWRDRYPDFPAPIIDRERSRSPLWYWPEVTAWRAARLGKTTTSRQQPG